MHPLGSFRSLHRVALNCTRHAIGLAWHSKQVDKPLASYPKSGRTWFRFILSSYLSNALALDASPDLHSLVTEMPSFDMDPVRGLPAFASARHQPKVPLIPVTHRPYSKRLFRDHPVIFLVREPKDIMVSPYFNATRQRHRFSWDVDSFLKAPSRASRR